MLKPGVPLIDVVEALSTMVPPLGISGSAFCTVNAGGGQVAPLSEITEAHFDSIFAKTPR